MANRKPKPRKGDPPPTLNDVLGAFRVYLNDQKNLLAAQSDYWRQVADCLTALADKAASLATLSDTAKTSDEALDVIVAAYIAANP